MLSRIIGATLLSAVAVGPAQAALIYTLDEFTGANAQATISVQEVAGGDLKFTVTVTNPAGAADIRAVFLNTTVSQSTLTATGANVTDQGINTNDLGNGAQVNPRPAFDFGVEIGGPGAGGGDFFPVTEFTVSSSAGDLSLATFFQEQNGDVLGLRLTSIPYGEGSAKLVDTSVVDTGGPGGPGPGGIPEPASLALLASGLLGLGLVRRRSRRD